MIKILNKKIKWIGYFFLGMLLFTFLSRTITGSLTPKVKFEKVAERRITQVLSGQGEVTFKEEVPITGLLGAVIETINVIPGQEVKQGSTLFTLSTTEISKKMTSIQREIDKLLLQKVQSESEVVATETKQVRSIQRAKEAYARVESTGQKTIARAQAEVIAIENQLNERETLDQENRERLQNELSEKQKTYEEEKNNVENLLAEAYQMIEQESDSMSISTISIQLQKDIEEKELELNEWRKLHELKGQVQASSDGFVTEVVSKSGDVLAGGAVVFFAQANQELIMEVNFLKEEQIHFKIGSEVQLSRLVDNPTDKKRTSKLSNLKIIAIVENQEDPSFVKLTVSIPAAEARMKEPLKLDLMLSSQKYETVIPVSSLQIAEGNTYVVYVLKQQKTILGEVPIASQVKVELLEKNNQFAAVTGVNKGEKIVTGMDQELTDNIKVKIDDN